MSLRLPSTSNQVRCLVVKCPDTIRSGALWACSGMSDRLRAVDLSSDQPSGERGASFAGTLHALGQLPRVEELKLNGIPLPSELSFLRRLPALRHLEMSNYEVRYIKPCLEIVSFY